MPRQDKRNEIMQAAEKLFTSRRFHEITLDDVARLAKVGKGTIYAHFKDKDDLFFQTATRGFEELCELLHRRVHTEAPFSGQLVEVCSQVSKFFQSRRQLFRMMQTEEGRILWCSGPTRERWMERRKHLVEAVSVVISRGVGEGQVRGDVPPAVLANFLLGLLRARARDLAETSGSDEGLPVVVDVFLNGARGVHAPAGLKKGKSS